MELWLDTLTLPMIASLESNGELRSVRSLVLTLPSISLSPQDTEYSLLPKWLVLRGGLLRVYIYSNILEAARNIQTAAGYSNGSGKIKAQSTIGTQPQPCLLISSFSCR